MSDSERYATQLAETKAEQSTYKVLIAAAALVIISIIVGISINSGLQKQMETEFFKNAPAEAIEYYVINDGYL